MDWGAGVGEGLTSVAPGTVNGFYIALPQELRDFYTDPTIVRVRGQVTVRTLTNSAVVGAFGIIAWSDVNDIPDEMPNPALADPYADWLYHSYFFNGGGPEFSESLHWSDGFATAVDTKAMRKMGNDRGLLFVIENSVFSVASIQYNAGFRYLLKE